MNIKAQHVFACESNPAKIQFLKDSFGDSLQHLFTDVKAFSDGFGHCAVCALTVQVFCRVYCTVLYCRDLHLEVCFLS